MKTYRPVFLIVIGLVIGAFAGWFTARHQFSKWATSFAAAETLPNLGDAHRALLALRRGDTNGVIEMLELRLDSEVIALSTLASDEADAKKRAGYMRALRRVRDYRATHPRKTDSPEIDRHVAASLASTGNEASK